jgi:hypothetical protein
VKHHQLLVIAFMLLSPYPLYPLGVTHSWPDVVAKIKISTCAEIRTPVLHPDQLMVSAGGNGDDVMVVAAKLLLLMV